MARADDLVLYHYDGCFYCGRVERVLSDLGVEVEHRDILENPGYMRELIDARGLKTVPVLRIRGAEGDEWLPESRQIVSYLKSRFARPA